MTAKHIKPKAQSLKINKPEVKKADKKTDKITAKEEIRISIEGKFFTPWQVNFIEKYFYQKTRGAMGPIVGMLDDAEVKNFAKEISTGIAQAAMWELAKENIINKED